MSWRIKKNIALVVISLWQQHITCLALNDFLITVLVLLQRLFQWERSEGGKSFFSLSWVLFRFSLVLLFYLMMAHCSCLLSTGGMYTFFSAHTLCESSFGLLLSLYMVVRNTNRSYKLESSIRLYNTIFQFID